MRHSWLSAAIVALASFAAAAPDPPPRGLAIDVQVVDEDGRPVPDARVDAFAPRQDPAPGDLPPILAGDDDTDTGARLAEILDPARGPRQPSASAACGPNGRARIEGLTAEVWTLVAAAPGRAPERASTVPGCDGAVTFELREGHPLDGVVRDPSGRPVADAQVVASYAFDDGFAGTSMTRVSPYDPWIRTDAQGRYRFDALPEGCVELRAAPRCTWRRDAWTVRIPSVRHLDLEIPVRGPLTGVVLDIANRQPVPGCVVEFRTRGVRARAVADAQGRYVLSQWPHEWIEDVTARTDRFLPVPTSLHLELPTGTPAPMETFVRRGVRLRGQVTQDGLPAPRAFVWIDRERRPFVLRAGADGRYDALATPSAQLALAAFRAAPPSPTAPRVTVVLPESEDATCDLVLPPVPKGPWLHGFVVDEDDIPVRHASLVAVDGRGTQTDAWGHFELPGPDPLTLTIESSDSDKRQVAIRRSADGSAERPLIVRLPPGPEVRVRGVVLSSDGKPVARAAVRVRANRWIRAREEVNLHALLALDTTYGRWTRVAPDGTFDVPLRAADDPAVELDVVAPGCAPQRRILDAPKSGAALDVAFRLGPAATLRGRVVDAATKRPVAGAHVAVAAVYPSSHDPAPTVYATTAYDGTYEVLGLPAERCLVAVSALGLGTDSWSVVLTGGGSTEVNAVLPSLGELWLGGRDPSVPPGVTGRLVNDLGRPAAGWILEGYVGHNSLKLLRVTTDAEGRFVFAACWGVAHVLAYSPSARPRAVWPPSLSGRRDDGAVRVTPGDVVSFEVVDSEGGFLSDIAFKLDVLSGGRGKTSASRNGMFFCMDDLREDDRVSLHVEKPGYEPLDLAGVPAGTARMRVVLKREAGK